jgi:hypothetical protein
MAGIVVGRAGEFQPGAGGTWMDHLDAMFRNAALPPTAVPFDLRLLTGGRPSDNVTVAGPGDPDSAAARQTFADFATDRMNQFDPYAIARARQAGGLARATREDAPALSRAMGERAGRELAYIDHQAWTPAGTPAMLATGHRQFAPQWLAGDPEPPPPDVAPAPPVDARAMLLDHLARLWGLMRHADGTADAGLGGTR